MTLEQVIRRLLALEAAVRGADYVRNQDEADQAEMLAEQLKAAEKSTTDSEG